MHARIDTCALPPPLAARRGEHWAHGGGVCVSFRYIPVCTHVRVHGACAMPGMRVPRRQPRRVVFRVPWSKGVGFSDMDMAVPLPTTRSIVAVSASYSASVLVSVKFCSPNRFDSAEASSIVVLFTEPPPEFRGLWSKMVRVSTERFRSYHRALNAFGILSLK